MLSSFKSLAETDLFSMFTPKRQLVGLDIGSSGIKLVQLKESRGRYILQKFGFKPLEPEVIVDGTVMDEGRVVSAIKELFEETNIKVKQVAVSISGHAVIIKKISLPPMPDEELEGQVRLAAEQYIPFDINEVNIDFSVLPSSEAAGDAQGEMSIILVAAKKDKINELTELVKGAGLFPIVMDVDAFAIENMHAINYPVSQGDTTALVNIGASVMNINIVRAASRCSLVIFLSEGTARSIPNNIDIHNTGANIDECRGILLRDRIVDRMHVFDRKGIHIHDDRKQPRPLDKFGRSLILSF